MVYKSYVDEANQQTKYVSFTEFYNEVLDEQYDIKEDFFAWKNKSGWEGSVHQHT